MKRYVNAAIRGLTNEPDDVLWAIVCDMSTRSDTLVALAMDPSVANEVRIGAIRHPNMPQETRDKFVKLKEFQNRGTEFEVTFTPYGMMWDPDAVYGTAIDIIKSYHYKYYKSDIDQVDNDRYVLLVSCNLVTKESDLDSIISDFKNIEGIGIGVLDVAVYDDVTIK